MNPLAPVMARIRDIRQEAEEVKTYALSLDSAFAAAPGQFNMLGFPGIGEAPISLSSLVLDGQFEHTVRAAGRATEFMGKLQKNDHLFLRGPYGRRWPLDSAEGGDVVLIAGGIGLAPLRPLVQAIVSRRKSFGRVSLICGARNERGMPFTGEFGPWGEALSLYLTVDEISRGAQWDHNVGLVTDLLDRVELASGSTLAFVCGPEVMMRLVCRGLLLKGIPQSRIFISLERRMKCGIAHCGHCQHYGLFVCRDGPVFSYKEVRGLPDGLL